MASPGELPLVGQGAAARVSFLGEEAPGGCKGSLRVAYRERHYFAGQHHRRLEDTPGPQEHVGLFVERLACERLQSRGYVVGVAGHLLRAEQSAASAPGFGRLGEVAERARSVVAYTGRS